MFSNNEKITQKEWNTFYKALKKYQSRPNVTGIDIGLKMKDGDYKDTIAVRIHVKEKFQEGQSGREEIPPKLDDMPTDVIEANYESQQVGAYWADPARCDRQDTIQPGLSVGHETGTAGTICAIVKDTQGAKYILGPLHVFSGSGQPTTGDTIIQPGPWDAGQSPSDKVATLSRRHGPTDSAIARLTDDRGWTADIYGYNAPFKINSVRFPLIGETIEKSGRTTGLTTGMIDGIGCYEGINWSFRLVHPPGANQNSEISYHGDSGAMWFDPNTMEGVGMHIQGEPAQVPGSEYAIAVSLVKVFEILRVALV